MSVSSVRGQQDLTTSIDLATIQPSPIQDTATTPGSVIIEPVFDDIFHAIESPNPAGQVALTLQTRGRLLPVRICPGDDIWLISARESHCSPCDLSRLSCSRLECGSWQNASLDELIHLHAVDKSMATMLYVHGNRTGLNWATSRGLQFYQTAFRSVDRPPVRFVIFAWRSDIERARVVVDYSIKSKRSVTIGTTLGKLLCQFGDREMVIGGFSLGAQVVLTALSSPELQIQDDRLGKFRVAFIAPALDSSFVQSCLMVYPRNPIVHQTEVFLNQNDCVLKVSRAIARRRNNSDFSLQDFDNMGETGLNKIMIRDITCEISKRHSIINYARSPTFQTQLAGMLSTVMNDCCPQSLLGTESPVFESGEMEFDEPEFLESETVESLPE